MEIKSTFSKDKLLEALKQVLPATENEFTYSIRVCEENSSVLLLNISFKEVANKSYILLKVPNESDFGKIEEKCCSVIKSVFVVEDKNNEWYVGFEKDDYFSPSKNNLEHLKLILKTLAEFQVQYLVNGENKSAKASEYNIVKLGNMVTTLEYFKSFDPNETALIFQKTLTKLVEPELVVKSFGSMFSENVFITNTKKCIFLELGGETPKSPVYDVLRFIFGLTDNHFRQLHLNELLKLYYYTFVDVLKRLKVPLQFTENVFENHVRVFLPVVKMEMVFNLINQEKYESYQQELNFLQRNLTYFLKYPKLNYEDCLEAISKKLQSFTFELIDYVLVALDEKNGHLGEYFFLKTKVKHNGEIKDFSMFTKVLSPDNDQLTEFVQSGLSEKEQFFFRTYLPELEKHGFQSILDFTPKVYFDRLNDLIIMEDLSELGYKPYKSTAKLEYEELRMTFLNAAKLHACTFLLEDRLTKSEGRTVRLNEIYGKYFKEFAFTVQEGIKSSPACPTYAKPGLDELIDTFTDVYKDTPKEIFQKEVDKVIANLTNNLGFSENFRNVVAHSDFYLSNLLTKYDQDGVPTHNAIVDFQLIRYSPPAVDLLFLIYTSANKEVRKTHLQSLLDEYYVNLKNILSDFDVDINTIYSPEQFKESVKYFQSAAICGAILYSQITALQPEEKEEIFFNKEMFQYYFLENRREYIRYMLPKSKIFERFLKELIQDLYDVLTN